MFVLGYTRMWRHHKNFPQWEGLDRTLPEYLYSLGVNLRSGLVGVIIVACMLLVVICLIRKARTRAPLSWVEQTLALLCAITTCWLIAPQAFENLSLYFMRIFALPSVHHVSFKGVTPPIPGGYITLASVDLPPLILISVFLMPLLFVPSIRRRLSDSEQQLWVMCALVSVMWILFLSTSSKQAWRYALPVAPQLYIIACLSLCAVGRYIEAPRVPLILLLLGQAKAVYRAYPHWDLYQSPLAPPPKVAAHIGVFHPRTGQLEALNYLITEAKARGQELRVTLFGDGKLLTRETARWFGKDAHWISLGYYREDKAAFVLVQGNTRIDDINYSKYLTREPIFQNRVKDVPVATVYKVVRPDVEASSSPPSSTPQLASVDTTDSERDEEPAQEND